MKTNKITYDLKDGALLVRLGRRIVGKIRKTEGGYHYKPKGFAAGDTFKTVAEVKQSIEED